MSEKINFAIFFNHNKDIPSKKHMIDFLFSKSSQWLHSPNDYMLLDWKGEKEYHGQWNDYKEVHLSSNSLLFVYDITERGNQSKNCIYVNEGKVNIIFTISLDIKNVEDKSMSQINDWIIHLLTQIKVFSPFIIAGGSEFEIEGNIDEITNQSFIDFSLSPFTSCSWILVPKSLVQASYTKFNTLIYEDFTLLYNAKSWPYKGYR